MLEKLLWMMSLFIMLSSSAFAGVPKSGSAPDGTYEFMSDVLDTSGSAPVLGGEYILYNSIGQESGHEIVSGSDYEMVGGFLGVVDETPPTIQFTTPTAASTNSNTINVIGTAFDENGTTWTLSYSPVPNPSVSKQLSTGSSNVTAATLVAWDASSLSGAYSLSITATDDRGNTATGTITFTINNSATISGTIPELTWMLLSMPVQTNPPDPVSTFGNDEYKVYRRDPRLPSIEDLEQYRYPETLKPGDAFWIKSYYDDLPYSYTGQITDTTKDHSIPVYTGWNQIGTPFNRSFQWGQVKIKYGTNIYDLQTAASLDLISSTLYGYEYDTQGVGSWILLDPATQMNVNTGYDINAKKDIELLFDPGAGMPGGIMRIVRPKFDYHLKISASTKNAADTDNFIGVTSSSDAEYDTNDAEEPPKTLEKKWISLYFPRDTWTRNAGRYAADFRSPVRKQGDTETYTFNVETTETGELVTLTWDNTALPSTYSFTLINLDAGESINMATQNSYTYTAGSGDTPEAHFKIEVIKLEATVQVTKTFTLKPGWNLISVPVEPEVTNALAVLGNSLPQLNVYQLFSGQFYPSESADIQSGIGYWVYVANNTEIDITGIPVPLDENIEVPLTPGWNLIGNPFDSSLLWGDNILVKTDTATLTLSEAVTQKILSADIYAYDGQNYIKIPSGSSLEAWTGYFVKASKECVLVLKK